jgi:hypothetical protein
MPPDPSPMKLVAQTSQFRVYDDVLSEKDFRAVWNHVQLESYVTVHQDGWVNIWRIPDGMPLAAKVAVLLENPKPAADSATKKEEKSGYEPRYGATRIYPTHTALDRVLASLVEHADDFADLVGRRNADYDNVSARTFLYPQGTGFSWHEDGPRYSGAFAFYAHPEWRSQWGGELLIGDESTRFQDSKRDDPISITRESGELKARRVRIPPFLDDTPQDTVLSKLGVGRFISPKPNRLVVIAGGTAHRINPVSPSAGDHVRCTIAGFFHRP